MKLIGRSKTSVEIYQYTLCNRSNKSEQPN